MSITTSVVAARLSRGPTARISSTPVEADTLHLTAEELLRDVATSGGGTQIRSSVEVQVWAFPSLVSALDAAVAMQQRIDRHERAAQAGWGLRVGVSTGDAVGDGTALSGEPIDEAVALSGGADLGEIRTAEIVRALARRTDHEISPAGEIPMLVTAEPMSTCALRWSPARAAALISLPNRLGLRPTSGVVGRATEVALLADARKAVLAGDGHRLVLLSGEPGIGKTTLACELAQRSHDEGATVLYGRCDEELGLPYQPFVEAIGGLIAEAPESLLQRLDERHLSVLSRMVPTIRDRLPSLPTPVATDADAERFQLFGAVTSTLLATAGDAGLVVVLDDLHWADKPSVLLLRHLVSTLNGGPVLLVGTYRDSDLTATHPLSDGLAVMLREPTVERVALAGLDDLGVVALLAGMAGHDLDDDGVALAQAVRRETDGNPFFTSEVLRHLAETDTIRQDGGRWIATVDVSSIGLPESVREVVGQRVRRLGADVAEVLTVASVIGRDFDVALLARAVDFDEVEVLAALEEAAATDIVSVLSGRSRRYTFTHALFQRTLYDDLSASRRARSHRRIGELIEAECGEASGDRAGELAHHWMAATQVVEVAKAAGYAHLAGQGALRALAPDEAIRWFGQAAELLESDPRHDPVQRLDALIGLGDAQRQAGDPAYRDTLLRASAAADELGEVERLVAAVLANQRGMVSGMGTVDLERIAMLERAVELFDPSDSPERAWLLASLTAELQFSGDIGRVRALAHEAESMARRIGDEAALLRVLNLTFIPLWWPDDYDRTIEVSEETLNLAARVGDPVARFWSAMHRTMAMATSVDGAAIDDALDLAGSLAAEIGQPFPRLLVLQARCARVLMQGHADTADQLGMEALQIGMETGQPDALMMYGANVASVRLHQGRLDEILPLIEQTAADNPGLPGFRAAHAVMLCEAGRVEESRPLFEAARGEDFNHVGDDSISLTTTSFWADTAAWLGDRAGSEVLFDRLAPFETQGVAAGGTFSGTVGMYLARMAVVLGRPSEALRLFAQADAQLRALPGPFWLSRNQVEWARLLITLGNEADLAEARVLLAEASEVAIRFGCGAIERRASEVLRSLG